jgi:hypothetical protein
MTDGRMLDKGGWIHQAQGEEVQKDIFRSIVSFLVTKEVHGNSNKVKKKIAHLKTQCHKTIDFLLHLRH